MITECWPTRMIWAHMRIRYTDLKAFIFISNSVDKRQYAAVNDIAV